MCQNQQQKQPQQQEQEQSQHKQFVESEVKISHCLDDNHNVDVMGVVKSII